MKPRNLLEYCGIYFVSAVLINFALIKFTGSQFQLSNFNRSVPVGSLAKFWHAWSFFGRSYNYAAFIGIGEFLAGFMILFDRTRLMGLLLATGIYLNIIIIDFEFEVGALWHAAAEFIIVLLLLQPYIGDLKKFLWDMGGKFKTEPTATRSRIVTVVMPVVFTLAIIVLQAMPYRIIPIKSGSLDGAFEVHSITIDGIPQALAPGPFTRSPMLFFEKNTTCSFSINNKTYFGTYKTKKDSIEINLTERFLNIKTIRGTFHEEAFMNGQTDQHEQIKIVIRRLTNKQ